MTVAAALERAGKDLRRALDGLAFAAPVAHVYQPLDYAWAMYRAYLRRFASGQRRVLLLGMNPGPFGMAQTGIPFGEVAAVRDWMGLSAPIGRPRNEHPKRPVLGLDCPRSEVSGRRLWGLCAQRHLRPEDFFADHLVLNYCPLLFIEASGRNRTPDALPATEAARVIAACDAHLQAVVRALKPEWVIGIGAFARRQAERALADLAPRLGTVLHPSPASPAANRGWAEAATKQLVDLGVWSN